MQMAYFPSKNLLIRGLQFPCRSSIQQTDLTAFVRSWIRTVLFINAQVVSAEFLTSGLHRELLKPMCHICPVSVPVIVRFAFIKDANNVIVAARRTQPVGVYVDAYIPSRAERRRRKNIVNCLKVGKMFQSNVDFNKTYKGLLSIDGTPYEVKKDGTVAEVPIAVNLSHESNESMNDESADVPLVSSAGTLSDEPSAGSVSVDVSLTKEEGCALPLTFCNENDEYCC